jgi:hypothetical protein
MLYAHVARIVGGVLCYKVCAESCIKDNYKENEWSASEPGTEVAAQRRHELVMCHCGESIFTRHCTTPYKRLADKRDIETV